MIYPLDFKYSASKSAKTNRFSVGSIEKKNPKFTQGIQVRPVFDLHKIKDTLPITEYATEISLWERYCMSSTVHGFKYITDRDLHWYER